MTDETLTNRQIAPYPHELADLVNRLRYRPSWRIWLEDTDRGQGSEGLTLTIQIVTQDTYPPHDTIAVRHLMPVPPAAYDARSWQRWLFNQILLVEQHEAAEFFVLLDRHADGSDEVIDEIRPYAPSHGPGNDPYLIREVGTIEDQRTNFRGELDD